jgi:3-deoxy-7-phosphoheptulonate synthase
MSNGQLGRFLISVETSTAKAALPRALTCLGLPADCQDPRCRLHDGALLVAHSAADAAVVPQLEAIDGVRRAARLAPGERLRDRLTPAASTVRLPNGAVIGGADLALIAGPCSVEGEAQIAAIAAAVKEAGAVALRGGAFKPRTSPYEFGGLGVKGLEFLAKARARTGLPIVTESLTVDDLDAVAEIADMVQIGSRSMYNAQLLFRAGAHPRGKPILLKRSFGATLDEFLEAAEYILLGRFHGGLDEPGLVLCERGVRRFDDVLRFSLDLAAIPLLHAQAPFPVAGDPSHAAGDREFVPPLALAAIGAGADALLVEVGCDPDAAWSDARQCLSVGAFRALAAEARAAAHAVRRAAAR